MMKYVRLAFLLLLAAILSLSCKKDSSPSEPGGGSGSGGFTEQEKQAIRQGYQAIASSADTIVNSENPMPQFQSMLATYRANPNVENAWLTNDALFVKFKVGGIVTWYVPSSLIIPPYDRLMENTPAVQCLLKPSELIGSTTALLINQQFGDEGRQYNRDLITYLTGKFQTAGFAVTTKNGGDANVNFFKTGLKNFGAIFFIAHGMYDGTNTWQCTGEEGTIDTLMNRYPVEWRTNKLSVGTVREKRGGNRVAVSFITFSQKLIDTSYTATDFPRSMIYLVACQGMKDGNRQVARSFVAKGARGVIGWDETNCLGQSTGKLLFTNLLCGKNLRDAVHALPAEAKLDNCAVNPGANLVYYPPSADTLRLVEEKKATFVVNSPKKDSTYTTRTLTVSGTIASIDTIHDGLVEVNGIATTLTVSANKKNFSQSIVINNGSNVIHISANGKLTDGRCAVADTVFNVTGNFGPLALWTELRWNTDLSDVDFHLLHPTGAFPANFWTTPLDCYYGNPSTTWGAFLDVDDVNGYGPEHITMPTARDTGTYRLFVHYYAAHGAPPGSAFVSVSVNNSPIRNFGPYAVATAASRGGDIWEVCTIHFPSGTITPVNAKRSAGPMRPHWLNDTKHR